MRFSTTIAVVIGLLIGDCLGKVAATSLRELADNADLIVIGRVTRVVQVKGVRVAEVQVANTIKGATHSLVYYLAQPTWTCDTTGSVVGEETIFFFDEYRFDPHPSSMAFVRPTEKAGIYAIESGAIPFGHFKDLPDFVRESKTL